MTRLSELMREIPCTCYCRFKLTFTWPLCPWRYILCYFLEGRSLSANYPPFMKLGHWYVIFASLVIAFAKHTDVSLPLPLSKHHGTRAHICDARHMHISLPDLGRWVSGMASRATSRSLALIYQGVSIVYTPRARDSLMYVDRCHRGKVLKKRGR